MLNVQKAMLHVQQAMMIPCSAGYATCSAGYYTFSAGYDGVYSANNAKLSLVEAGIELGTIFIIENIFTYIRILVGVPPVFNIELFITNYPFISEIIIYLF